MFFAFIFVDALLPPQREIGRHYSAVRTSLRGPSLIRNVAARGDGTGPRLWHCTERRHELWMPGRGVA